MRARSIALPCTGHSTGRTPPPESLAATSTAAQRSHPGLSSRRGNHQPPRGNRQHPQKRRYPPSHELGRVGRQPLREVVVGQGLLGDLAVPHQEAVQGPEVMQEAHQKAEDQGGEAEEEDKDPDRHVHQPQEPEHCQGEESDGDHLQGDEHHHPDAPGEDTAFARLAVSQVGHGDPVEIVKAVAPGMVTEICLVVTVCPKVPLA